MRDDPTRRAAPDKSVRVAERRSLINAQRPVILSLNPYVHAVRPAVKRGFKRVHKNMMARHSLETERTWHPPAGYAAGIFSALEDLKISAPAGELSQYKRKTGVAKDRVTVLE